MQCLYMGARTHTHMYPPIYQPAYLHTDRPTYRPACRLTTTCIHAYTYILLYTYPHARIRTYLNQACIVPTYLKTSKTQTNKPTKTEQSNETAEQSNGKHTQRHAYIDTYMHT